ncbi:LPXTG-motif cell wall anchor domain protein [Streptococcus mitis]|nr:LPXTG-motif cell wall anchor domain protein [Streptococcus mitis]
MEDKVKAKNPGKEVTVGEDGTATLKDPTTGISHQIPGSDLVNQDFTPVKPDYEGSVNSIPEEIPAHPDYDGSANGMSEGTPTSETTINKDRQLPNTGTEKSNTSLVVALLAAMTGGLLISRKRKEEE